MKSRDYTLFAPDIKNNFRAGPWRHESEYAFKLGQKVKAVTDIRYAGKLWCKKNAILVISKIWHHYRISPYEYSVEPQTGTWRHGFSVSGEWLKPLIKDRSNRFFDYFEANGYPRVGETVKSIIDVWYITSNRGRHKVIEKGMELLIVDYTYDYALTYQVLTPCGEYARLPVYNIEGCDDIRSWLSRQSFGVSS